MTKRELKAVMIVQLMIAVVTGGCVVVNVWLMLNSDLKPWIPGGLAVLSLVSCVLAVTFFTVTRRLVR